MLNINLKKIGLPTMIFLVSPLLINCGGGGGTESTPNTTSQNVELVVAEPTVEDVIAEETNIAEPTIEETIAEESVIDEPSTEELDVNLYLPNEDQLTESATESNQLYAKTDFSFDSPRLVTLWIGADDVNDTAITNARIHVYVVNQVFDSWQTIGSDDRELVTSGRTNSLGYYETQLEVSAVAKQLLVSVGVIGIENKVLLDMDDTMTYYFNASNVTQ